ncbi:MAG: hypothetical protein WD358_09065 [Nitriliruptoraceae bacterium]
MSGQHPEPLAADRRVLAIGLIAMVAFVAIGVFSASVFTASACADIEATDFDASAVVAAIVGEIGDLTDIDGAWPNGLAIESGSIIAGVDVTLLTSAVTDADLQDIGIGADTVGDPRGAGVRLAPMMNGAVAIVVTTDTGIDVVTLEQESPVDASARFGPTARVVGDGSSLFVVAHINDLTGQLDALRPVSGDLSTGVCVDTALVGSPFAFHLAAEGGELLLLRVEEDATDPLVELRDASGRRWATVVDIPVAPPGFLGERVTAAMGADVVAAARRFVPDDGSPAITGFSRADGELLWTVGEADLMAIRRGDDPDAVSVAGGEAGASEPLRARVIEVDDDVVIVALAGEVAQRTSWWTIDATTGTVLDVAFTPAGGFASGQGESGHGASAQISDVGDEARIVATASLKDGTRFVLIAQGAADGRRVIGLWLRDDDAL